MPRRIAFLIFPDFQILDAAGPLSAFEIAGRLAAGAYELRVIAARAGAVRSSCGASLNAGALPRAAGIDTLIVAGGDGTRAALALRTHPAVRALLRRAGTARHERVLGIFRARRRRAA